MHLLTKMLSSAEEGLGGDPELEAADRANQGAQPSQEEGSDEDDWTPKDAKELAKKQRQMAKSGITFTSKVGPEAKVRSSSISTVLFQPCLEVSNTALLE